jgi:hypothetical protein
VVDAAAVFYASPEGLRATRDGDRFRVAYTEP